ncbi:MAG: nucleotidyltransferase family protein [Calditrichaeota bacterium]|nr:MAG: nucleotidyltransferase family protein [Calditrichota bacterium]
MADKPITGHFGAVVLAAGKSSRMRGQNKLLLPFHNRPVILHVLQALQQGGVEEIVVVIGHQAGALQKILPENLRVVVNPDFAQGLSTSIKAGLQALPQTVDAAFVVQADMPLLEGPLIAELIRAFRNAPQPAIVIPCYRNRRGNPVLFSRYFFPALKTLQGDQGARNKLEEWHEHVIQWPVQTRAVVFDLDTPEDYRELMRLEAAAKSQ